MPHLLGLEGAVLGVLHVIMFLFAWCFPSFSSRTCASRASRNQVTAGAPPHPHSTHPPTAHLPRPSGGEEFEEWEAGDKWGGEKAKKQKGGLEQI